MRKIGLKLWSANTDHYLHEAERLYADNVFDYIELYYVPGGAGVVSQWKSLGIPYVVHAPHSAHGVNLAASESEAFNLKVFSEVRKFADALESGTIVVHGGILGSADEIIRQLKMIQDTRILIENKPYFPVDGSSCLLAGSTPDEIKVIKESAGCGFCLDIGHAVASANAHGADWRNFIDAFLFLKPSLFHLSDIDVCTTVDQHLHFGCGNLPIEELLDLIPADARISIETEKGDPEKLDDFRKDVKWLLK